jgi:hypothetical protein
MQPLVFRTFVLISSDRGQYVKTSNVLIASGLPDYLEFKLEITCIFCEKGYNQKGLI